MTTPSSETGKRLNHLLLTAVLAGPAATAVVLLSATGGIGDAPSFGLPDPGPFTRWGLPVSRGIRDVATAVALGALALAAMVLPGGGKGRLSKVQLRLVGVAAAAAAVWQWSAVTELFLAYSEVSGEPPFTASGAQMWFFATEFGLGVSLTWSMLLAAFVGLLALTSRSVTGVGIALAATLAALWAMALTGHAADARNHDLAVNLQFLHLLAIGLWVGGLLSLVWVRRHDDVLTTAARRYSRLAGWCYAAVALSGVGAALLRLPSFEGLRTSYGALLLVKVTVFTALGVLGWSQRRRAMPGLAAPEPVGDRRWFTRFALAELVFMAVAIGAGTALSRTPPPEGDAAPAPTAAEALLGYPMPPPLGAAEWLTQWRVDTFWAPLAVGAIVTYLVGVHRLRRRGDRWPLGRTIAWIVGCAGLVWATSGSPGAYGDVLFSMHIVQHMTVATAVPTFLVLGAPVTLALRSLRRRDDKSRGAREWLLVLVHSWPLRLLGHPIVAGGMFIVSMVVFYYSTLFEQSLRSHTVHLLMTGHFLFTGYLFANVMCGVDPGPRRPIYPLRLVLLMVVFAFHAFFAIALMNATALLAGDWFVGLGRTWGRSVADDQYLGASLGWALGEYPLAILGGAVVWSWFRDDHREAKRLDRQADRDDDQALGRYNDYLRSLRGQTHDGERP